MLPFMAVIRRPFQFVTGGIRTHVEDSLSGAAPMTVTRAHDAGSCGTVLGRCLPKFSRTLYLHRRDRSMHSLALAGFKRYFQGRLDCGLYSAPRS